MLALASNARLALACLALESGEETTSESIGAGIQRVIDHVEAHIADPAQAGAWRSLFGGSRSHFHRQFLRATGHTTSDYFMRLKVRKACGLLATSGQRIAEIAEEVGVGDPYYFSRLFRRITGVCPRQYREGHTSPAFGHASTAHSR
jgi:AraC-like DNA-binding protein